MPVFRKTSIVETKGGIAMPKVLDLPIRRCRPSEDVGPFSEHHNNLMIRSRQTVYAFLA